MTDSSTSQSNSDTLLEAQPSASLLGVQKPLLTPNALGQGRDNSTSLIPLGSRRITVLDPSFFQRKPMMEEESEFSFSDSISADTPELGNTSEFLVSSSPSEKIQRSLSSKRQNQKSSPIIATSDNSSLSEVPIDPTAFDNTSSLSFQSSPHGSLQLKEELESSLKQSLELPTSASQLTSSLQAESKISIDQFINSNVKINRSSTENDQLNFSSSIERDSSSQGLSAVSLPLELAPEKPTEIFRFIQRSQEDFSPQPHSVIPDLVANNSNPKAVFNISESSNGLNLKHDLSNSISEISITPNQLISEQPIQRYSVESNSDQIVASSQSVNTSVDSDPVNQRSTSSPSVEQNLPNQALSPVNLQLKTESEPSTSVPSLIQRSQEVSSSQSHSVTSNLVADDSNPEAIFNISEYSNSLDLKHNLNNSVSEISIAPTQLIPEQPIQRYSVESNSDQIVASSQSIDSSVESDHRNQLSTSSLSVEQNLSSLSSSPVNLQLKVESENTTQTPSLIRRSQEASESSSPNLKSNLSNSIGEISIAPQKAILDQPIQRDSVENTSDQIITSPQSVNSSVDSDWANQRSTSLPPVEQNSFSQGPFPVNLQLKIESEESIQIPSLIQRSQEDSPSHPHSATPDPVVPNSNSEAIFNVSKSSNNLNLKYDLSNSIDEISIVPESLVLEQPIQRYLVENNSELVVASSQSVNAGVDSDRASTDNQRSIVSPSVEPEKLIQTSSLIQRSQETSTSSQIDISTSEPLVDSFTTLSNTIPQSIPSIFKISEPSPNHLITGNDFSSSIEMGTIVPENKVFDQPIQRSPLTENFSPIIDSSQATNSSLDTDRSPIENQQGTFSPSVKQDLSSQAISSIDLQLKVDLEKVIQPSVIQREALEEIPSALNSSGHSSSVLSTESSVGDSKEINTIVSENAILDQSIQRSSISENSDLVIDSSQSSNQSINSNIDIDRSSIVNQRSDFSSSIEEPVSQGLFTTNLQLKLEPEKPTQTSNVIQRSQEPSEPSQVNLTTSDLVVNRSISSTPEKISSIFGASESVVGLNSDNNADSSIYTTISNNQIFDQSIQRFMRIEKSAQSVVDFPDISQSMDSDEKANQVFTENQRSNPPLSIEQDSIHPSISPISLQLKAESEESVQLPSLIQRSQEVSNSSQFHTVDSAQVSNGSASVNLSRSIPQIIPNVLNTSEPSHSNLNSESGFSSSKDTIAIENQPFNHLIQRSPVLDNSTRIIDLDQAANQAITSDTNIDRSATENQQSIAIPLVKQDTSGDYSTVDLQLKLQPTRSEQVPSSIQRSPAPSTSLSIVDTSDSFTISSDLSLNSNNNTDKITSKSRILDHSIQRPLSVENYNSVQMDDSPSNSTVEITQNIIETEQSISLSENQNLPIQLSSDMGLQAKLEEETLTEFPNLTQNNQEAVQRSVENSNKSQRSIHLSQSISQESSSSLRFDRESSGSQQSTSYLTENQDLQSQLSLSSPIDIDLQLKSHPESSNQIPSLIQKKQESSTQPQSNSTSLESPEVSSIPSGQIEAAFSNKLESRLTSLSIQRSSDIEAPGPIQINSSKSDVIISNTEPQLEPLDKFSYESPEIIQKKQEFSSPQPNSIPSEISIQRSAFKDLQPLNNISISETTVDSTATGQSTITARDVVQSSSNNIETPIILNSENNISNQSIQRLTITNDADLSHRVITSDIEINKKQLSPTNEASQSVNQSIYSEITNDQSPIQRSTFSSSPSASTANVLDSESSPVVSLQTEQFPSVLKGISILKPLIQSGLQRSSLETSNSSPMKESNSLNSWSTIPQSHSKSSQIANSDRSSQTTHLDNYHQISLPSHNSKPDVAVMMNSPQQWSSLESLVQMKSEPYQEPNQKNVQSKSLENSFQTVSTRNTSTQNSPMPSSYQEVVIQRKDSAMSSPTSLDQNYIEVSNNDHDRKFNREDITKSEEFEALAQEVYLQLRQRLVIDQERKGNEYSGRLPW